MEGIWKDVENDALDAIDNLMDPIIAKIMDVQGTVPKEIWDYSDSYHHERIELGWKGPKDAIAIIEELSDHEAAPVGGWDKDWRDALAMLADETYRNAVISRFSDLMESLNSEIEHAERDGKIQWQLPEPELPTGVLDWSPGLYKEQSAFQRKREEYREKAWPKIEKQLRRMIEAFIKRERP
jgi:hypothetical protein